MLPWLTVRDPPMLSPRLMLLTSVMATLMLTLVSHSDLALVWTPSPRDWILPLRAMFLTTDTDIMPTVTITERGPLRLRLTQRPTPPSSMVLTVTHTVWATTLATLDTPDTPMPMVVSLPPTLLWDTPWPTPPVASLTPLTWVSAPTTSELLSLARQSARSQQEVLLNLL